MEEKILKTIEEKRNNKEELNEYLTDLKNRGVMTQRQVNLIMEEVTDNNENTNSNNKLGTRTPKTMEYAYSNMSAGFSQTGLLVLIAMSVPVLVAMANLLNK